MDSISPSATNAAGGTRVIGVGCRYYTTLRRGVFICEYSARSAEYERTYGGGGGGGTSSIPSLPPAPSMQLGGDYTIFAISIHNRLVT